MIEMVSKECEFDHNFRCENCGKSVADIDLWEFGFSISQVIKALLEWGNGSGEELYAELVDSGLSTQDANTVINLLNCYLQYKELEPKRELFDWKKIKELVEQQEPQDDFDGCCKIKLYYLGSVFNIMPSGKYYTPWACSNVTEEEARKDEKFRERMEQEAEKYGLFVTCGEGDPTDIFVGMVVEEEDSK